MRNRVLSALFAAVLIAPFAAPVAAQSVPRKKLFVNTGPNLLFPDYRILRYGGRDFDVITGLLSTTFEVTTGPKLPTIAELWAYDALWLDQRYAETPTANDLSTILGYAASGHRVVIIGENSSPIDLKFMDWSAPIIAALGGIQGPGDPTHPTDGIGCRYGTINTILTHSLTAGVASIGIGCAGYAIGGTALFNYNVATLWGERQNVLTVLDANAIDDDFWGGANGPAFRANMVTWLTADVVIVPEPATAALFAPALLSLAAACLARRRISV